MSLKPSQRMILVCASFIIFLMGMFPPWTRDGTGSAGPPEHSFILTPVREPNGMRHRLDAGILLAEAMVILGASVSWCLLLGRSPAQSKSNQTLERDSQKR